MIDRYYCYGKDDLGYEYDAMSRPNSGGDWVRSEDYDAIAARLAEAERIMRGIRDSGLTAIEYDEVCEFLRAADSAEEGL